MKVFKPLFPFFLGLLIIFPALSQEQESLQDQEMTEPQETEELSEEQMEAASWKFTKVPYTYQNVMVPREFWTVANDILKSEGVSKEDLEEFAILPISMQVELYSQEKFVLKDELNHRILFTEGGGTLDLFDYVVGKGQFYIKLSPGLEDENGFHMLYISDSPGKKVGGDPWGNGCGKIFDLSESATPFMVDRGMSVTSSRRHYLHLMAGTFIVFQLVEDRLFLGYIRLTDSRYPQFKCRDSQE